MCETTFHPVNKSVDNVNNYEKNKLQMQLLLTSSYAEILWKSYITENKRMNGIFH